MKNHIKLFTTMSLLCISSLVGTPCARTLHVRQDGSGDAATINGALALAQSADTILVGPGYYWESRIWIYQMAIHLISEAGPEATTIRLLRMSPDEVNVIIVQDISGGCSIIGFTITGANGGLLDVGGGIDCENAAVLIKGNIIKENWCSTGGGIYCWGPNSPIIEENLICNNEAWVGGAIDIVDSSPLVINNTIVCNRASDGTSGICISGTSSYPTIAKNVIAFDSSSAVGGAAVSATTPASHITFECNDVWGNSPQNYFGTLTDQTGINGNISQDPLFCGIPGSGNYYLQEKSPCAESHVPAYCLGFRMGCYAVKCPVGVQQGSWGKIKNLYKGG